MNAKNTGLILLTAILVVLSSASSSFAVSEATVLFLRIAAGARAAGMGEAFVAVADDASATHWNPAGLGTYPLSDSWYESDIPEQYRPISAVAALRKEGGSSYMAYDIWAITPVGLARYDYKRWYQSEVFSTPTDQTVAKFVSSYFRQSDEGLFEEIISEVARVNNERSLQYLKELADSILVAVPKDYSNLQSLASGFDTLIAAYNLCRVNWVKVAEIEKSFVDGKKDGELSEQEIDRIDIAVERGRNRFIPEDLRIPYGANIRGDLRTIASSDNLLLVGTSEGLIIFNGRNWRTLTTADGLPSNNILCIQTEGNAAYVGTDKGLARLVGPKVVTSEAFSRLPEGPVGAIGSSGSSDVWAVVNNDLYHFNGTEWANQFTYTVTLDDSPERIAEKMALYGSASEKEKFLAKYAALNETVDAAPLDEDTTVSEAAVEFQAPGQERDEVTAPGSEVDTDEADSTLTDSDSTKVASEEIDKEASQTAGEVGEEVLESGTKVMVPYLVEILGQVNTIRSSAGGGVWLGTDHGVLHFDGSGWDMPGYGAKTVEEGQTLAQIAGISESADPLESEAYLASLTRLNGLEENPIAPGQSVKVRDNPAGNPINKIELRRGVLYFATTKGLIEFDGTVWRRVSLKTMNRENVLDIKASGDELWFVSDRKIVSKANGRREIVAMHSKWLPALADDLYYEFVSFTAPKEGLGTFGGSFTFLSFGTIVGRDEFGNDTQDEIAFEGAITGSFGKSLTKKLKGGISARLIHSRLWPQGAGSELGKGVAWGFALDFGLLYQMSPRLTWGLAVTNLGPEIAYIDAAQSDPPPRNMAFGFAFKALQTDFYHLLLTAEMNKLLVRMDGSLSQELKEVILNGGGEFVYNEIFAARGGYIYDQEGDIKTVTFGFGVRPMNWLKFDFAYIPSGNSELALANTLRSSITIMLQ